MFDLDDLGAVKAEQGSVMQVVHPTKGPIEGMTMTLLGMDSPKMQACMRDILDENARLIRQGKVLNQEHHEKQGVKYLVSGTVAWTGFARGGKDIPCTPDNVNAIYTDPKFMWLRKQANLFIGDDTHFFAD